MPSSEARARPEQCTHLAAGRSPSGGGQEAPATTRVLRDFPGRAPPHGGGRRTRTTVGALTQGTRN
eukprot:8843218-Pyramimonas_sp.AAC.1